MSTAPLSEEEAEEMVKAFPGWQGHVYAGDDPSLTLDGTDTLSQLREICAILERVVG